MSNPLNNTIHRDSNLKYERWKEKVSEPRRAPTTEVEPGGWKHPDWANSAEGSVGKHLAHRRGNIIGLRQDFFF
jgi:hypothetical protein